MLVLPIFVFQPDLIQTGEEEISRDISRLEDKYLDQVTLARNLKAIKSNS